jgi:hypothetical protein
MKLAFVRTGTRHRRAPTERGQLPSKAFNIGCSNGKERDQQRDKAAEINSAACFNRWLTMLARF